MNVRKSELNKNNTIVQVLDNKGTWRSLAIKTKLCAAINIKTKLSMSSGVKYKNYNLQVNRNKQKAALL